MFESLTGLFASGAPLATGAAAVPPTPATVTSSAGVTQEAGSILGMSPSKFASIAGAMGTALAPKDSWQAKLGGVASQMGNQKIAQMMQAEREKRSLDLIKQMMGSMTNKQLAAGAGLEGNGLKKTEGAQSIEAAYTPGQV